MRGWEVNPKKECDVLNADHLTNWPLLELNAMMSNVRLLCYRSRLACWFQRFLAELAKDVGLWNRGVECL